MLIIFLLIIRIMCITTTTATNKNFDDIKKIEKTLDKRPLLPLENEFKTILSTSTTYSINCIGNNLDSSCPKLKKRKRRHRTRFLNIKEEPVLTLPNYDPTNTPNTTFWIYVDDTDDYSEDNNLEETTETTIAHTPNNLNIMDRPILNSDDSISTKSPDATKSDSDISIISNEDDLQFSDVYENPNERSDKRRGFSTIMNYDTTGGFANLNLIKPDFSLYQPDVLPKTISSFTVEDVVDYNQEPRVPTIASLPMVQPTLASLMQEKTTADAALNKRYDFSQHMIPANPLIQMPLSEVDVVKQALSSFRLEPVASESGLRYQLVPAEPKPEPPQPIYVAPSFVEMPQPLQAAASSQKVIVAQPLQLPAFKNMPNFPLQQQFAKLQQMMNFNNAGPQVFDNAPDPIARLPNPYSEFNAKVVEQLKALSTPSEPTFADYQKYFKSTKSNDLPVPPPNANVYSFKPPDYMIPPSMGQPFATNFDDVQPTIPTKLSNHNRIVGKLPKHEHHSEKPKGLVIRKRIPHTSSSNKVQKFYIPQLPENYNGDLKIVYPPIKVKRIRSKAGTNKLELDSYNRNHRNQRYNAWPTKTNKDYEEMNKLNDKDFAVSKSEFKVLKGESMEIPQPTRRKKLYKNVRDVLHTNLVNYRRERKGQEYKSRNGYELKIEEAVSSFR